jgi:hypothetical protein
MWQSIPHIPGDFHIFSEDTFSNFPILNRAHDAVKQETKTPPAATTLPGAGE